MSEQTLLEMECGRKIVQYHIRNEAVCAWVDKKTIRIDRSKIGSLAVVVKTDSGPITLYDMSHEFPSEGLYASLLLIIK